MHRVPGVDDLQDLVRLVAGLAESGEIDLLVDRHAARLQLLLDFGFRFQDLARGLLTRLVGLLDQRVLILLRQAVEPFGADDLEIDQHDVPRLVGDLEHLVEAAAGNVVVDQFDAVDRPLLQPRIHFAERHRDRHGAERANRLLPDRRRRGANAQALQVIRRLHRLVGEEMPIALHPVEGDHLEPESGREFFLPFQDGRRLAQPGDLFERLDEIGPVHHGDAGDVVAHPRGIGVLADIGALPDLLDDVFLAAELRGMEHLDLDAAIGALLDGLGPLQESLVVGLLGAEHVIEFQRECFRRLRQGVRTVERPKGKRSARHHSRILHRIPSAARCRRSAPSLIFSFGGRSLAAEANAISNETEMTLRSHTVKHGA